MVRFACGLTAIVCAAFATIAGGERALASVAGGGGQQRAARPSWAEDHVRMTPRAGVPVERIAAAHGARVIRPPGPSGQALVAVPPGRSRDGFLAELQLDPDVMEAGRDGLVYGAVDVATPVAPGSTTRGRWHIEAADVPPSGDARGVVVALLDTGIAYEDRVGEGQTWRQAPSLAGVRFVAPWDFIHGDAHPNDDHQHGTHLASLIAGHSAWPGLAPEVSLMPVKVLDDQNVGTEVALVDGLVHAAEHGANVINMSLSFGRGYVPSRVLVDALERAHDAGAVLVAAAGNDGGDYVTWPAASPLVIAVGAIRPEGGGVYGAAPYGNRSPRVDIMAPGGSVDRDRDGDGLVDGVIGETIALGEPTRIGYWLYAGTSQASALVSAAAARLIAAGEPANRVAGILQASAATEPYIRTPWLDGRGRGRLDVAGALAMAGTDAAPEARDLSVAVTAWLSTDSSVVRPAAKFTVLDEHLLPVAGVDVVGSFTGARDATFTCHTDAEGACTAVGPEGPPNTAPAWLVTADDVVTDGVSVHPRTAVLATDGLQALVGAAAADPALVDAVPAWRWRAQDHPTLGPMAESLVVANLGTARATAPTVLVASPTALGRLDVVEAGDLEGCTEGASPGRVVRPRRALRCDQGPSAWELVEPADAAVTLLVLDAVGAGALGVGTDGVAGFATNATPVVIGGVSEVPPGLSATPIGRRLADGGWTAPGGEPAATLLAASADIREPRERVAGSGR